MSTDWSKYIVKSDESPKNDWSKYVIDPEESKKKKSVFQQEAEEFEKDPFAATQRKFTALGGGIYDAATLGVPHILQALTGATAQDDLRQLMQEDPNIDPEAFNKASQEVLSYIPTGSNILNKFEEKTGYQVAPKTDIDKALMFMGTLGGFDPGNIPSKIEAGLKAGLGKEIFKGLGLTDEQAELASAPFALFKRSPQGFKLPKEPKAKVSQNFKDFMESRVPSGESPLPPGADPIENILSPGKESERLFNEINYPGEAPPPPGTSPAEQLRASFIPEETPSVTPTSQAKTQSLVAERLSSPKITKAIETAPLTDRNITTIQNQIENAVSSTRFRTDASGARNIHADFQGKYRDASREVNQLYAQAKEAYGNIEGLADGLYNDLSEFRNSFNSYLPSTEEGRSVGMVENLLNTIGDPTGWRNVNAQALIKTADSISSVIKYESLDPTVTGRLRTVVSSLNRQARGMIENAGLSTELIDQADAAYQNLANSFRRKELTPFLRREQPNLEAAFKTLIQDPAAFRAMQPILETTPQGYNLSRQLQRRWSEDFLKNGKYLSSKPNIKINSREFTDSINNLEEIIGREPTQIIRNRLSQFDEASQSSRNIARQGERNVARQKQIEANKKLGLGPLKESKITGFTQKQTLQVEKQIEKYTKMTAQEIEASFKDPKKLSELQQDVKSNPKAQQAYDQLVKDKITKLFTKNKIDPNWSGEEFYSILNNKDNFEIVSQALGKEQAEQLRIMSKKIGKGKMTQETLKKLGWNAAKFGGASRLAINSIKSLLP